MINRKCLNMNPISKYSMYKKDTMELPEKIYPDMDLPKWMTSQEKAVILFDDL